MAERKAAIKGEIIIYSTKKGPKLEVQLKGETVWLDSHRLAKLFDVDRTGVVRHIANIYKNSELKRNSTCAKIAQVAEDGKVRKMDLYNLDMILSVGYRVNSKRATQFRIWATKTLKNHLVRGYTINEKRLAGQMGKLKELQEAISFLREKSSHKLLADQSQELLNLLDGYAKSFTLLEQYDKNKMKVPKGKRGKFRLEYDKAGELILDLKKELAAKREASDLFGREVSHKFESIAKNLYQTFGGKELYATIEQKAAHILYLTIKDHPFADGNKRIASFMFVYFLDKNNYLLKKSGERKINDNALVALALLIAVSQPKEKEMMIKLITNLLA